MSASERNELIRAARAAKRPTGEIRFSRSNIELGPHYLQMFVLFWWCSRSTDGGIVGYRTDEESMARFQAETARQFSDLVGAKSVTLHDLDSGEVVKLR